MSYRFPVYAVFRSLLTCVLVFPPLACSTPVHSPRAPKALAKGCATGGTCLDAAMKQARKHNDSKARGLLERACSFDSQSGCAFLAAFLARGVGGPANATRARGLAHTACSRGNMRACGLYGDFLRRGEGGAADHDRALGLLRKACVGGDPSSCSPLAEMMASGHGVEKDDAKARELFAKACSGRDWRGCNNLARMCFLGLGGPKNDACGVRALGDGCKLDHADACMRLANWYAFHKENTSDVKARNAVTKACGLGIKRGCMILAVMLYQGAGGPKDQPRALALLEEACKENVPDACTALAGMKSAR